MTAATMDDDAFRAFRKIGLPEGIAAKVARIIRRDDEFVTKVERDAERDAEREAARAVREAERKADRDTFAAKDDVTVLQTKAKTVDEAIISIDKRFERIDATLADMKEMLVRMDEQMKAARQESRTWVIPLLFATLGALIALLTKGILWGVAP